MSFTCDVSIKGEEFVPNHHTFIAVPRVGETVWIGVHGQAVEYVVEHVTHHSQAALGGGDAPKVTILLAKR